MFFYVCDEKTDDFGNCSEPLKISKGFQQQLVFAKQWADDKTKSKNGLIIYKAYTYISLLDP